MASQEEFAAFIRSDQQGWARQAQAQGSPGRPPHRAPKHGEQAPLLPPMPQSALPPPLSSVSSGSRSRSKRHGRSQSDFNVAAPLPPPGTGVNRSNRPPRASLQHPMIPPSPPTSAISPISHVSPHGPAGGTTSRKSMAHRRIKSDIPLALFGVGGNIPSVGGRLITKADLLKNLPCPRWGGPIRHSRSNSRGDARSRTGSDGHLLPSDLGSVSSGGFTPGAGGYGAISSDLNEGNPLQSIGSVHMAPLHLQSTGSVHMASGPGMHKRLMSDASAMSVTIDMAKSALFKGVTDTGRIRMQLPKDSFRILADSQLETGSVYKRKLVDNEDEFFVEFHTVDDLDSIDDVDKRLPPDLYVMAVDGTIYRRMLDEVIASKSMPCGTFFCGHHEDVRHPDITIAAVIVGMVFLLLVACIMWVPNS